MRQFAWGLVVGLVIAGGVAGWLGRPSRSVPDGPRAPDPTHAPPLASLTATPTPTSGPPRVLARDDPPQPAAPAVRATPLPPRPVIVAPGLEKTLVADHAHEHFGPNPATAEHDKLSAEPRDEAWASQAESDVRRMIDDYAAAHAIDPSQLALAGLECRSSACELQLVLDQALTGAGSDKWPRLQYQLATAALDSGTHFNDMLASMFGSPELPKNTVGVVLFLQRAPAP